MINFHENLFLLIFLILTAGIVFPISSALLGWIYCFGQLYIIALEFDFFGRLKPEYKIEHGLIRPGWLYIGYSTTVIPNMLLFGLSIGSTVALTYNGYSI